MASKNRVSPAKNASIPENMMQKVISSLNKRQPPSGDSLVVGNPSFMVSSQKVESLISGIVQSAPLKWKDPLIAFLRYEATRSEQLDVQFPLLVVYVKALTRAAADEPLWAATLLRRNCQVLVRISVAINKRSCYDDAAAVARQAFRITVSDFENEEPRQGRTRECYAMAVCLLMFYVRMRAYSLADGILQAIAQYRNSIAPLEQARWHTQLVFLFHQGLLLFTKQKYADAAACFDNALAVSKGLKFVEFEHIMAFHIPAKYLAHNQAPTASTWESLPKLAAIYRKAITSCRQGNVAALREEIQTHRSILVQQRVLLAFESMVPRATLNLLRRVWLITGKPRRLEIAAFTAALRCTGSFPIAESASETEVTEFYIAQLIMEGKVKGYIHHELQLIMLSGTRPFPTLVRPR